MTHALPTRRSSELHTTANPSNGAFPASIPPPTNTGDKNPAPPWPGKRRSRGAVARCQAPQVPDTLRLRQSWHTHGARAPAEPDTWHPKAPGRPREAPPLLHPPAPAALAISRTEAHTAEFQSPMRIASADVCSTHKNNKHVLSIITEK